MELDWIGSLWRLVDDAERKDRELEAGKGILGLERGRRRSWGSFDILIVRFVVAFRLIFFVLQCY